MAYIEMKHSYKRYQVGDTEIVANRDVNLKLKKGSWLSYLALQVLENQPFSISRRYGYQWWGEIWIDGANIANYSSPTNKLSSWRCRFCFSILQSSLQSTAKENVELASRNRDNALDPEQVLTDVGLAHRLNNFPAQLSGGQQQSPLHALAKILKKFSSVMNRQVPWITRRGSKSWDSPRHVSSKGRRWLSWPTMAHSLLQIGWFTCAMPRLKHDGQWVSAGYRYIGVLAWKKRIGKTYFSQWGLQRTLCFYLNLDDAGFF